MTAATADIRERVAGPGDEERELTAKLRRGLRQTWQPFYGRFGRLTAIQLAAMPPLMSGRDVLICAPTATGKTEAAVAPLTERMLRRPTEPVPAGVRILYVTPTRALANDLDQRLRGTFADLDVTMAVRTGERREIDDGRHVDVLITTPESLDSLLARKRRNWSQLEAVILDEIHLVDGRARGDQLRVLMERLRSEVGDASRLRIAALSATVSAPEEVVERYLPGGLVVDIGTQRPFVESYAENMEEVVDILRAENLSKAIVFVNTRRDVEHVVQSLREGLWPTDRVVAHHGSLSRKERTESEAALRRWTWGIAVATTTLEIGIDVGNIDAVVLWGVPRDIEALLQRMGRACRRGDRIRVIAVVGPDRRDDPKKLPGTISELGQPDHGSKKRRQFELAFGMARSGELDVRDYAPDRSVVVQQVLSLLFQHSAGLPRAELTRYVAGLASAVDTHRILAHLVEHGHLQQRQGRYQLTQHWVDEAVKGRVHSTIADERSVKVIDARSGALLGEAAVSTSAEVIRIAGRAWAVVRWQKNQVIVMPTTVKTGLTRFAARDETTPFTKLLPDDMQSGGSAAGGDSDTDEDSFPGE